VRGAASGSPCGKPCASANPPAAGFAPIGGRKVQSAPCAIPTEIDFDEFDERVARRLYVGATRATMRLSLVVSEGVARKLLERME
jgi:hypothetical protein